MTIPASASWPFGKFYITYAIKASLNPTNVLLYAPITASDGQTMVTITETVDIEGETYKLWRESADVGKEVGGVQRRITY